MEIDPSAAWLDSTVHRDTFAVAAYTQSKEIHIGIDLETVEPRAWSFVEDFFTTDEAAYARTLPISLTDRWVTIVWSAKEAVLKAWHKGLRLDTRSVEILPGGLTERTSISNNWIPLKFRSKIVGFPDCWLFWQHRGKHILTLAVTKIKGDPSDKTNKEPPEIHLVTDY